jgi:FKBP-type peptidyl-prolyl cis-trans isomerase
MNIFDHTKQPLEEVKLTEDGGIVKRIFERGDEGREMPADGDKVHVLYEGRLASNNSVFDKSVDPDSAFKFKIG